MTRYDFLKRAIRYALIAVLAIIAFALGKRVATGSACSSCAGNGICSGTIDCTKYASR